MGRRNVRGNGGDSGGIVGLARFVQEHGEAIDYDLLTLTGHGVDAIGKAIPWRSVKAVIDHAPAGSALARELYPEYAAWGSREKTNAILADIFDVLSVINANLMAIGSGKRPKQPKPYPRPGASNPNERKIGRGALPHDELVAFFERKRREHERHDRSREGDSHNYS